MHLVEPLDLNLQKIHAENKINRVYWLKARQSVKSKLKIRASPSLTLSPSIRDDEKKLA